MRRKFGEGGFPPFAEAGEDERGLLNGSLDDRDRTRTDCKRSIPE